MSTLIYLKRMLYYNRKLQPLARELRKNMTDAEKLLWSKVCRKQIPGYQFYRQRIIGDYIVDFYCHTAGLVVEIDGGQHYNEEGHNSDKIRDDHLAVLGLKVLRFSNLDVPHNIDGVVERIYLNLNPPEFGFSTCVTSVMLFLFRLSRATNSSALSELFPFKKGGK